MDNSEIESKFYEPMVLLESKHDYLYIAYTVKSQMCLRVSNQEIQVFLKDKQTLNFSAISKQFVNLNDAYR